jgi:arylformamidase
LLKTNNSVRQYARFRKDFAHVDMDAAKYLISAGVRTLGIDYLSVKKFGKDDDVHALIIDNMTLFEGLNLKWVKAGEYTFIGLPLRMATDGSPARALLLEGRWNL